MMKNSIYQFTIHILLFAVFMITVSCNQSQNKNNTQTDIDSTLQVNGVEMDTSSNTEAVHSDDSMDIQVHIEEEPDRPTNEGSKDLPKIKTNNTPENDQGSASEKSENKESANSSTKKVTEEKIEEEEEEEEVIQEESVDEVSETNIPAETETVIIETVQAEESTNDKQTDPATQEQAEKDTKIIVEDTNTWKVPAKFNDKKNPYPSDAESLQIGKQIFKKHCASCHGKTGRGDGSKAEKLKTSTGDFKSSKFQSQSDGSIFYKTAEGRDEMPGYKKKIPDEEDMWHLVNFLRSLG